MSVSLSLSSRSFVDSCNKRKNKTPWNPKFLSVARTQFIGIKVTFVSAVDRRVQGLLIIVLLLFAKCVNPLDAMGISFNKQNFMYNIIINA